MSNVLAAIGVGIELGLDIPTILKSTEAFEGVDGRLQHVKVKGVDCFVDFAHTPDGLDKMLGFLARQKGENRLIAVFGAPGNRDKEKRPLMGEIAAKHADVIIATDDDPSTENRLRILDHLTTPFQQKFLPEGKKAYIIPERRYAIKLALDIAKPGDLVVLAGKGHEQVQLTNFGKRKRSDRDVVLEYV